LTKKNKVLLTSVFRALVSDLKIKIIDNFYVEKKLFFDESPKIKFLLSLSSGIRELVSIG